MVLEEKHSLMDIQLCSSIIMTLNKHIQIKRLSIISLKPKQHKQLMQMVYRYSSLAITKLRSILVMELKKLFSLMVQSNVFLLMGKKKAFLLMELFKELKRKVLKQLNMQVVKKIFYTQMEQELESTQMVE